MSQEAVIKSTHEHAVKSLIHYLSRGKLIAENDIGLELLPEGMKETPKRFLSAFRDELLAGYAFEEADIEEMLTQFEPEGYDELIIAKGVEFYSCCEHHLLPFHGIAHIAYIPDEKIAGISKLARVLDVYARRFQNQERIARQTTEALMTHLKPKAAACILNAKHFCMCSRGVNKQRSEMITSCMQGKFREEPETRAELLRLIGV